MTKTEKQKSTLINLAYIAVSILIGYFAIKYALGIFFPFVLAFLIASILQKPKNFLVKRTFLKSGSSSAICVFFILFFFIFLMSIIGVKLAEQISGFYQYVMVKLENIDQMVNTVEVSLNNIINSLPEFAHETLKESVTNIFIQIREYLAGENSNLGAQLTESLSGSFTFSWITTPLNGVISTAKQIPSVAIGVIITIISCCFITADYDTIVNFIKLQFPENRRADISRAKVLLKTSLGKMGKAYLLLILVTFSEMAIGLTVLQFLGIYSSNYILVIAAIVAIVDIVPVLGTGTILTPWAIYSLIVGNTAMGIGLIVIYVVVTIIRQVLEPKLVAGQLGMSPILTIAALYLGTKWFGIIGIFIAPIGLTMIKLLNDEGIINVWKSPTRIKREKEEKLAKESQNSEKVSKNNNK